MCDPSLPEALRAQRYGRRAARYAAILDRLKKRIAMLAFMRLGSFLGAAAFIFAAFYDHKPWPYAPIGGLFAAWFAACVFLHRRPYAVFPLVQALCRQSQEARLRLERAWDQLPNESEAFLKDAPHLSDLQVFGRCSAYQMVGRCHLPQGQARLRKLLVEGLTPGELPSHQEAARELSKRGIWRARFEAESARAQIDEEALEGFFAWAGSQKPLPWLKPLAWVGRILVVLTWIFGIGSAVSEMTFPWRWTLGAQALLFLATTTALKARYVPLLGKEGRLPLLALGRLFALCEKPAFQAEAIVSLQTRLRATSPSVRLQKLTRTLESLAVRLSPLTYAVANLGFLLELHCGDRLERWRLEHGMRLRDELGLLGQMEVWGAIGGFAADHAEYGWPQVFWDRDFPDRAPLLAEAMGHPLFDPAKRRVNSFTIARSGQVTLITGSNMSGKSSFLRTVGLCSVMAQAGLPVCARRFELAACRFSTSIQVNDAPDEGLSRFYAEVCRMKQILDDVSAADASDDLYPRLFLVDEMLSGTNSRERNLASDAILRRLSGSRRSFGLVTTHDLALAHLCDGTHVLCKHFSDRFDGEKLHFDYQICDGVAQTTNALQVLRLAGIDVPDCDESDAAPE